MKIAISIMLALVIMGCSKESSNEAQNSEPTQVVAETSDNAQAQTDDAADQEKTAPVAQETTDAADGDAVEADANETDSDSEK
ncbi:hypothetical protein KKE54_05105 [bacterium]|jgi:hypothetical protein|nr:hypothetical protein [bacterium]